MNTNIQITKQLPTEEEMLAFGRQLAQAITSGAIIYLYGPLGAGKTTLTRGFLRGCGYDLKVKSPTYTLVEPYTVQGKIIFHFDLYRLTDTEELEHMGIREYFSPDAICLIEWPEKGSPLLPSADLACYIAFKNGGREVRLEAQSEKGRNVLRAIE